MGDLAGAKARHEPALASNLSNLGLWLDHPDAATTCSNLGIVLSEMGDLNGARSCMEQALPAALLIKVKLLGTEHSSTAIKLQQPRAAPVGHGPPRRGPGALRAGPRHVQTTAISYSKLGKFFRASLFQMQDYGAAVTRLP